MCVDPIQSRLAHAAPVWLYGHVRLGMESLPGNTQHNYAHWTKVNLAEGRPESRAHPRRTGEAPAGGPGFGSLPDC